MWLPVIYALIDLMVIPAGPAVWHAVYTYRCMYTAVKKKKGEKSERVLHVNSGDDRCERQTDHSVFFCLIMVL